MKKKHILAIILGALCFTGCQLLKPYQPPCAPEPKEWKNEDPSKETRTYEIGTFDNWWTVFNDPKLSELESLALENSNDLWSAYEKVLQSREQAMISRSALFPQITLAPALTKTGDLFQSPFNFSSLTGTTTTTPSPFANIPSVFRFIQSQYIVPLNLSYELDIWYQLRNAYQSSLYEFEAMTAAYYGVMLTLTTDLASHYYNLRAYDAQIDLIEKTIEARKKSLDLTLNRFKAGIISYLDVSQAELDYARAKSDVDDIRLARGIEENAIAVLIGTPASEFTLEKSPLVEFPPDISAGFPSELLTRRPDIQQAERVVASNYKQIGVAYANFFPSLKIGGAIGFESPVLSQLFKWQGRLWEITTNIMQTVFDGGKDCANFIISKSVFRQSVADYEQTVLTAFRETEDALISLKQYKIKSKDLADAVKAADRTYQLASSRYKKGIVTYLDVVQAERDLLDAQQSSDIALGNLYTSTIHLVKAIGGSWLSNQEPTESEEST